MTRFGRNLWICSALSMLTAGILCNRVKADVGQREPLWEQTDFSAEYDTVVHPVPLPESVLQILRNDRHVSLAMKGNDIPPDRLPPKEWFAASEIHLGRPVERDLVVMGVNGLRGANVNTFWVFRKTAERYELVLHVAVHDLKALESKSNGYRDIQTWSSTAVTHTTLLFKFDGRQYQLAEKKTEP